MSEPNPAILAAVDAAMKTYFPEGEGPQAQNFAKLRDQRIFEIATKIPADAAELADLRGWKEQHAGKVDQFGAMEKFYAAAAVKESPEYKTRFLDPLETARQDLKDLATEYQISEQRLGELLRMDPKARRTALEKEVSVSFASDFDGALRAVSKAERAIAEEDNRLKSADHAALLADVDKARAAKFDPNASLGTVIDELAAGDDPFFKTDEGKALLAGLKGKAIDANSKTLAVAAVKAAAYEKLKGQVTALQAELDELKRGKGLLHRARTTPSTPAPAGGGGGKASSAPVGTGTFN